MATESSLSADDSTFSADFWNGSLPVSAGRRRRERRNGGVSRGDAGTRGRGDAGTGGQGDIEAWGGSGDALTSGAGLLGYRSFSWKVDRIKLIFG
jgi:hypothetical protein